MSESNLNIAASQSINEKKYWLNHIVSNWEKTIIEKDTFGFQDVEYEELEFVIPEILVENINKLSSNSITKLQIILTAGLVIFLTKYLSKNKVSIGTSIDKQECDANYINTMLPLCFKINKNDTFKDILLQSRDIVKQALENQNFPLGVIAAELEITKEDNKNPFFDIGIVLENIHDSKYIMKSLVSIIFSFNKTEKDLTGKVLYNKNKYSSTLIDQILYLYLSLFEKLLKDIDQEIRSIQLLPEKDQQEFLAEQNKQTYDFPLEFSLIDHIRNQILARPNAIAIGYRNEFITFKEIDERSNIIANELIRNNVNSKEIVAILLQRSPVVVISMLGVLKAGCAYVTIDLDTPIDRINYILDDSNSRFLITDSSNNLAFNRTELKSKVQIDIKKIPNPKKKNIEIFITPDYPAYLIYTSGSTGKPKGVLINHRSVVNFMFGMHDKIYSNYDNSHVFGLVSPFIFDASVQLTYGALLFGNKLQILSNYERANSKSLLQCIEKYGINILDGTPVHLDLLVSSEYIRTVKFNLKHIIIGGDVLRKSKVLKLYELLTCDKPNLTNVYGPTECCVNATFNTLNSETIDEIDEINIGKPLPNYKIYILNQYQHLCPEGVSGEMYIGGESLAAKYINNDKLTGEKFIKNPFNGSELLYRTGDIAKWTFDGSIDFIGRSDSQIKIRGYRIELGEIEETMLMYNKIKDVVCVVKEDNEGDKKIYSFFTCDETISIHYLKEFIVKKIPHYMIPSFIIQVEELPLKPNGKVNKKALLDIFNKLNKNRNYKLPGNKTESVLHTIWLDCLKLEKISIDDSYFSIGGDSIRSIYLLDKINKEFQLNFDIADIYQNDTIEKFAKLITERKNMGHDESEELKEIEDDLATFKNTALSQL